ncbi:MAG: leucine-rich repeat domain-containing protein, partial [Firmicutes bacterium]|nr:leucine-rich repeat domain-containing protein [Bacillota bacterium]
MKKKLFFILFVIAAAAAIFVFSSCSSGDSTFGVRFNVYDDYAEVSEYVGGSADVVVGDEYKGVPVTKIADGAFKDEEITSITLPDSLTTIGANAFEGSTLETVTFGSGLTEIGDFAFLGCTSLSSVEIPEGVTVIEEESLDEIS